MKRKNAPKMTHEEWKASVDPVLLGVAQKWLKQFGFEEESVPLQMAVEDLVKAREMFAEAGYVLSAVSPDRRASPPDLEGVKEALTAAIRAAKLALFVIRKQGVMPNSSWEAGFNGDLKKAETVLAALSSLPNSPGGVGDGLASVEEFVATEVRNYENLFEAGKGEHGKPGYVTDATWNSWSGSLSSARSFLEYVRRIRALATAPTAEGTK